MRSLPAAYFLVQATAGVLWWAWLLWSPSTFALFWPPGAPASMTHAFLVPDAAFFVGASAWTARLLAESSPRAVQWAWLTTGAVGYATLFCLAMAWHDQRVWAAAVSMSAAFLLTILATRSAGPT